VQVCCRVSVRAHAWCRSESLQFIVLNDFHACGYRLRDLKHRPLLIRLLLELSLLSTQFIARADQSPAPMSKSDTAMFAKDFLAAPLSVDELTQRLNAVLEETRVWPQGGNTDNLKIIAKNIGECALQRHASVNVRFLVACIAADILRVYAPDTPYDRNQLQSIFSLFLSSFEQLCDPSTLSASLSLLERLVQVRAFSLAADQEIFPDALQKLINIISMNILVGSAHEKINAVAHVRIFFSHTGAHEPAFTTFLVQILGIIDEMLASGPHVSAIPDVCAVLTSALTNAEDMIRRSAVQIVCTHFDVLQRHGDASILTKAGTLMHDKEAIIRREAMQLCGNIYYKATAKERDCTYGWIICMVAGMAKDPEIRGDVAKFFASLWHEHDQPSSSASAIFISFNAILVHVNDAGFAGIFQLIRNKYLLASELGRACKMVCQPFPNPIQPDFCIQNIAECLPENLRAADQLQALFAYPEFAPKLLECLAVVHDSVELRKRKRELDDKLGQVTTTLTNFVDELFVQLQIGCFDCRWVQGLLSSLLSHDIRPHAFKLTKIVLTFFPATVIPLLTTTLRAQWFQAKDLQHVLSVVFHGKLAKQVSRAILSFQLPASADNLVSEVMPNLQEDKHCIATLGILQQCAIIHPMSIMKHATSIIGFVQNLCARESDYDWLVFAQRAGIKLIGLLTTTACMHEPLVAKCVLDLCRDVISQAADEDASRVFAAQVQLLLKKTVEAMRTLYRSDVSAGTAAAAHLLPERILPMVVHLLAHHPDLNEFTSWDDHRTSFAKITITFVMEALVSGSE